MTTISNLKAAAVAIAALLLIVPASILIHSAIAAPPAAQKPAAPAKAPPPAAPTTQRGNQPGITLANGVTIEILGVADPATGKWWHADGSPLAQPAFDLTEITAKVQAQNMLEAAADNGGIVRALVVRMNRKLKNRNELADVRCRMLAVSSATGNTSSQRQPVTTTLLIGVLPADTKQLSIRCDVADAGWKTAISTPPDKEAQRTADGISLTIRAGKPADDLTQFDYEYDGPDSPDTQLRLVVVDNAGQVHSARSNGGGMKAGPAGATTTHEYRFDVPLKQIKEVQLQFRSLTQSLEFRNLCADPAQPTQPEVTVAKTPKAQE